MMTAPDDVESENSEVPAQEVATRELMCLARDQVLSLTVQSRLLKQFTTTVLKTALNEETTEHLGHDKNRVKPERESSNARNGRGPKRC